MNTAAYRQAAFLAAAAAVGALVTWFVKPTQGTGSAYPVVRGDPATVSPPKPGTLRPDSIPVERVMAASDEISKAIREVAALNPEEFGDRLAEVMMMPNSPDKSIRRAAMTALLDGERAAAFYEACKRHNWSTNTQNDEIRTTLVAAGQKDGRSAMTALLRTNAKGFPELSSFVSGWAMSQPAEVVDWVNSLAADSPLREMSLQGLIRGLATNDYPRAAQVLNSLAPEDQQKCAKSFTNGMMWNRQLDQFDSWLATADPNLAAMAMRSVDPRDYIPLHELVPWLAKHLEALPSSVSAPDYFQRWAEAAPEAAFDWLAGQHRLAEGQNAFGEKLRNTPAVDQWLRTHPDHPFAARLGKGAAPPQP